MFNNIRMVHKMQIKRMMSTMLSFIERIQLFSN